MATPQLSIVIPAYNESARIEQTLERVMACVERQGWDAEVLVVDDGSVDRTVEIVHAWMERTRGCIWCRTKGNRGKGYSVRNGLLQAAGEVVMFTDADLSAPMEEAERLLAAIRDGADVAIGSRWMDRTRQTIHQPLYRRFFGRCFNGVTRTVMGLPFKDTQCGFKAFRREAAQVIFRLQRIERWGFDPEILFIARKLGYNDPRGAGDLGTRRAQPDELPEGRHEDAGGDGGDPGQLDCGTVRPGHRGAEGHQRDGDSAGEAGEDQPQHSGLRVQW
jgi:glycosyltransferase involved in cell wall biosynthesis